MVNRKQAPGIRKYIKDKGYKSLKFVKTNRWLRFLLIGTIFMPIPTTIADVPPNQANSPSLAPDQRYLLLSADDVAYDEIKDTVTATGNVQIVQGDRALQAEKITYNRKTAFITAEGDVWLKEPVENTSFPNSTEPKASPEFSPYEDVNGNLIPNPLQGLPRPENKMQSEEHVNYTISFAPYAEFSNKFQDGFINEIKMLMSDNAHMAAHSAKRIEGRRIIMRQAVYSPCKVCRIDPTQKPLWQLKADKVIHSKEDQMISYHHARLEMKGVPVFYLPYFRHADPTVKRKTGFLMPTYGAFSDLGTIISAPFYYEIAPNRDLTLVPTITTKQGPLIVAEYRHRFRDGEWITSGSYTQTKDLKNIPKELNLPPRNRWHIFTQGRFDLNDEHLATFDINKASDTTYLRRYPITPHGFRLKAPVKNLVSTAAIEQFREHSYGVIRASAFQTDNLDTTPYALPHAWYNYQSDPGKMNDVLSFDANFLSLGRRKDTPGQNARHMQRLSLNGGWRLPYVTSHGHIWVLQMALRRDGYLLEHYQPVATKPITHTGFRGRLFPTVSAQWRYPLINRFDRTDWVLEPTTMIVGAPRVNNASIPNEDSTNIQIDDTNLFLPQRFPGLDRVDTGGRFVYGANSTWYFPQQRLVQWFLGHSLRMDRHRMLPSHAGEDRRASDIVSRFRLKPLDGIQLLNRVAIRHRHKRPRISDTSAILGKKLLNLQLNHTFVNKRSTTDGIGISQATWALGSQPWDHWRFCVGETRNLKRHQRGSLSRSISTIYHDECFQATITAFRSRSSDRDIRPNSGFIVQFNFKNLGSINPLSVVGVNANNIL